MQAPKKPVLFMLLFTAVILLIILIMQPLEVIHFRDYIAVLFPQGKIGIEQRDLLFIIQAIMLIVIIPVYALTFIFSWKYRADNPKAKYDPDLVDNVVAEYIWWGLPLVLTLIICGLTWYKTYELDPYKPIETDKKPLTVQVVALQWKWLFIYPEEQVASLNFLQIPVNTPLRFEITADAPMNSFWIPELGGQIYAMPGMRTLLHLIADHPGEFRGSSANISGAGFADMHFMTNASSEEAYQQWLAAAKQSSNILDAAQYEKLVVPSARDPNEVYRLQDANLFNQIIMKYMHPKRDE